MDSDDWVDYEEPLTLHEKELFEARLAVRFVFRVGGGPAQ